MSENSDRLKNFKSYTALSKVYFTPIPKKTFSEEPKKSTTGSSAGRGGFSSLFTSSLSSSSWSFWDKIELFEDTDPNFIQEDFLGNKYSMFPELVNLFGSDAPHSSLFLLHYGRNWEENLKKSKKLPVLLVPGAGDHAHRSFADPSYGIRGLNQNHGIAQYLSDNGYPVFAITFAHTQGCNFMQSEQIVNAIRRIKKVCKTEKVDVIAHSKGNIPVRMYISNITQVYLQDLIFYNIKKVEINGISEKVTTRDVHFPAKKWMTPFQYDIRRFVQLGSPNKGIDTVFRTFSSSIGAYLSKQAPIPFVRYFREKSDIYESMAESIYYEENKPSVNNYFPGQCQLLYNLSKEIPLKQFNLNMDMLVSLDIVGKMYFGGHSILGDSYGIDYAIAQGGNLIEFLRGKETSNYVEIATLCGTKNLLDVTFAGVPIPLVYEGIKSDGLLFYASASDTGGITNSMGVYDFPVNHLELTFNEDICKFIDDLLSHK